MKTTIGKLRKLIREMTEHSLTLDQVKEMFPQAYHHLVDEGETDVDPNDSDMKFTLRDGILQFTTHGGDPGVEEELYTWEPEQDAWVSLNEPWRRA